jgi:hypothetical protein
MFCASFRSPLPQHNALLVAVNALGISENSKNTGTVAAEDVLHIRNVQNMLCVRFDALLAQCGSHMLRFPNQTARSTSLHDFWYGCAYFTLSRPNTAHTGMKPSHVLCLQKPLPHQYSASFRQVGETSAMMF